MMRSRAGLDAKRPSASGRALAGAGWAIRLFAAIATLVSFINLGVGSALALEPIVVNPDAEQLEITANGIAYEGRGDTLQIETAPGSDGLTGRMSVKARTKGTDPNWIVFALSNPSRNQIERWLVADRYELIGSGAVWPDLDAERIARVTPSLGFVPERVNSDRADIFRVTLEPGQTITYVAELSSDRFARIHLWKPIAHQLKVRDRQLLNGILLGITIVLVIALIALFAANHRAIFPSAALVACCVLAYLCVDFGFFHKMFNLRPEDNAVYRAATESAIAASLVIFLHTFLGLTRGNGIVRMLMGVWIFAQLALVAVAVVDPRLSATFARLSFLLIGAIGALSILYLAFRGQNRALSLSPTWLLLLVWVFAAAMILTGRLNGDIVSSGLGAGMVLISVLIGFTVTQSAFRTMEPLYGAAPSEQQLRTLAVDCASSAVWEWSARRDEVKVGSLIEELLGLNGGELSTKVDDFVRHVHSGDRERFKMMLWSMQERDGGSFNIDLRMRHANNTYRWFSIEGSSVPSSERRNLRCVGLMRDITEAKRSHERLLTDAVHDCLTALPNRELFLDRLKVAMQRADSEKSIRPTVLFIDIDKFKNINASFGLVVGDSLLKIVAVKLTRHLSPQDTLARVGSDQFAILFLEERSAQKLAALAERIRRSLCSPIAIAGQEVELTGSIGIAVWDGEENNQRELMKEAEIAMYRAKRGAPNSFEIFRPEMRTQPDERVAIESDLRKALDAKQIKVYFQPIIYLPTEELAGFEALVRWEHPKLGLLSPSTFIPIAEESDLIVKLGSYVLMRAALAAARWHKELPRSDAPLFVSVNISSRQLLRHDLIPEIRHIVGQSLVPHGTLRLELTESLAMEDPERAAEMMEMLRGAGAELALDDFGTGFSSLSYLNRFPFDTIKVDQQLVRDSAAGAGGAAPILRSIVALAHEFEAKVIAEGVESEEDVSYLHSIGCEYGQGFYYGEAMPDREVISLLRIVEKSMRKLEARSLFRTGPAKKKKQKPAEDDKTTTRPPQTAPGAKAPAASSSGPSSKLPDSQVRPMRRPPHGTNGPASAPGKPPAPLQPPRVQPASAPNRPNGPRAGVAKSPPPPPRPRAHNGQPKPNGPPPQKPSTADAARDRLLQMLKRSEEILAGRTQNGGGVREQQPPAQDTPESKPSDNQRQPQGQPEQPVVANASDKAPKQPETDAAGRGRPGDFTDLPPGIAASLERLAGSFDNPAPAKPSKPPQQTQKPQSNGAADRKIPQVPPNKKK